MSSYFACISIARRHISFEYHQEGASKSLAPFPADESWPVPLALYCTPNKIEIGHAAERAAACGVPGAFKEWFQHLSSGETVNYLGQQQPVSHLLLLAAEEQLRTFLRDVRYNMDGGLENCRASMPLVLCFEDDVNDSMRIFIVNLFKNNGYGRIYEHRHNRFVASYHGPHCQSKYLLIIDSDGVDLTLSLYEKDCNEAKVKRVVINAGIDPRLQSLCNMIWDKTGAEYSFLDRTAEQPRLEQIAAEIISANQTEYEGMMHYSNGERLSFIVSRSELIASGAGSRSVVADVIAFLEKEARINPNDVTIVLRNFAAKSDYFSQAFNIDFPNIVLHDEDAIEGVNKNIVNEVLPLLNVKNEPICSTIGGMATRIASTSPQQIFSVEADKTILKEKRKQWREVKAEANGKYKTGHPDAAILILKDFYSECGSILGMDDICSEIQNEIDRMSASIPSVVGPTVDGAGIKRLEREWREVRASAKGKVRNESYGEAKIILDAFMQRVLTIKGADSLLKDIKKELMAIPEGTSTAPGIARKEPSPSISDTVRQKQEKNMTVESDDAFEGDVLIKQGKLKEARDWYRSHNDMRTAGILTDIIRSKKGIDIRRNSFEEHKKSKNKDQINRIVKEIEEFIDLCRKVPMPIDSYRKLLNDYKRI